jgi:hypothetical protein
LLRHNIQNADDPPLRARNILRDLKRAVDLQLNAIRAALTPGDSPVDQLLAEQFGTAEALEQITKDDEEVFEQLTAWLELAARPTKQRDPAP